MRAAELRLAVAQPPCVAYDVAANARLHAEAVCAARSRVVVFPELSLTGYELDAPALEPDDPRLAPIVAACAETGSLALVGAPIDGPHIGMLTVHAGGASVAYRKMYPGGAEGARFSPGPRPVVLDVDGWRLGLAICKDSGIRQHAADTAALGIDAYLVGILEAAEDARVVEERALRVARDHGVWVAMASFAGSTGGGYDHAAGGSGIWSPDGTAVARAGTDVGAFATAVLTL